MDSLLRLHASYQRLCGENSYYGVGGGCFERNYVHVIYYNFSLRRVPLLNQDSFNARKEHDKEITCLRYYIKRV